MVYCGVCPPNSGKSLIFSPSSYGLELSFNVIVTPQHIGGGTIQIHTWNQPPNHNLDGRIWYKNLPQQGGEFKIKPSLENRLGISFFQKNPSNLVEGHFYDKETNSSSYGYWPFWDCCCVEIDNINQTIIIKSF